MNPLEQYKKDVKAFKLGLVVVVFTVSFYFLNSPQDILSKNFGIIESCKDYRFLRETGKELTIKLDNGTTKTLKFHKCDLNEKVLIEVRKRLITRQYVYTIKYI